MVEIQLINWRLSKWNPMKAGRVEGQISKKYGLFDPNRRVVDGHTRPCEECGAVDWQLDDTRGEIICNSCGIVVEENVIDPGAEWTNRDKTEDRSRVGQPLTYTLCRQRSQHVY